jgi:mono/diheme cytochrome c family protein
MTSKARSLALALGLLACGGGAAAAEDTPGDAANGKRLFLELKCFTCHGRSGQGGAFNYPAPALAQLQLPLDAFQAILRDPPNDMPAFVPLLLSDKGAADILAFLGQLPGRKPVKDFRLLNQ